MTSAASSKKPKKPKLFLLRRVLGDSMLPALTPGMLVVGLRVRRIRPGDVVVVHHQGLDKIKRVEQVQLNKVFLTGDNYLSSTDSRDFGWLDKSAILVKVVWPTGRKLSRRVRTGAA